MSSSAPAESLTVLTLNTGQQVLHDLTQASDAEVVELLRPWLATGGGVIPGMSPLRLELVRIPHTCSATFSVYQEGTPIATCGFAADPESAADVWRVLEALHFRNRRSGSPVVSTAGIPVPPAVTPWLGVVFLPGLLSARREHVGMLGELHRCIARTLLKPAPGSRLPAPGSHPET